MLRKNGFHVSVDSGDPAELRRGAVAGADFLLSLNEHTLDVANTAAIPVLIPARHGDLDSLERAFSKARARGSRACWIQIPLTQFIGFTASLQRYAALRAPLAGCRNPDGHGQSHRLRI